MATKLTKPITRSIHVKEDWNARGWYNVTLTPANPMALITFREKKKQKAYTTTLRSVLKIAIQQQRMADYREAMATYTLKKKAGYKGLRRPKKPVLF